MDFGRLPSLDGVVFKLPPLEARSREVLARGGGAGVVRIGAPAWARKDWLGKLYPHGTAPRDFLRAYARRVGAIELNASGYALPESSVLAGWMAQTPPGFRFCPKLPRAVTHEGMQAAGEAGAAGLAGAAAAAQAAGEAAARFALLGERLGRGLLQLPPWFAPDRLAALDALLAALPMAVAVELRHPGWFDFGALRPRAREVLERRGAATVITDVAGRRDVCHASLTTSRVLVRFVGNGGAAVDLTRLDGWAERIGEWRAGGLDELYFFVHQPDDLLAPELLAEVVTRFNARAGTTLPALVLGEAPRQLRLL